jgi:hypothetical protein
MFRENVRNGFVRVPVTDKNVSTHWAPPENGIGAFRSNGLPYSFSS